MNISQTSVADGIPFDPELPSATPIEGHAIVYEAATNLWKAKAPGATSSGVTPPFVFSKSGGAGTGAYLKTGEVVTNKTGQIIVGSNTIIKMIVSSSAAVGSDTTIQFQRRTGISTFVDIPGAAMVITSGNYAAELTGISVNIGPNYELACYNKSGGNLTDPIVILFVVPQ